MSYEIDVKPPMTAKTIKISDIDVLLKEDVPVYHGNSTINNIQVINTIMSNIYTNNSSYNQISLGGICFNGKYFVSLLEVGSTDSGGEINDYVVCSYDGVSGWGYVRTFDRTKCNIGNIITDEKGVYIIYMTDSDFYTLMIDLNSEEVINVSSTFHFIFYGNGYFVMVCSDKYGYSSDGRTWVFETLSDSMTWSDGCFGNGKYYILGDGETNNLACSSDLTNWTYQTCPIKGGNIISGDDKLLAYKQTNCACSTNGGETWTSGTMTSITPSTSDRTLLKNISYGAGKFLYFTNNHAYYSINGVSWSEVEQPSNVSVNSQSRFGNGRFLGSASSFGTNTNHHCTTNFQYKQENEMSDNLRDIFDSVKNNMYPINSIYMTESNLNPQDILYFGTWELVRTSGSGCLFYWKRLT